MTQCKSISISHARISLIDARYKKYLQSGAQRGLKQNAFNLTTLTDFLEKDVATGIDDMV